MRVRRPSLLLAPALLAAACSDGATGPGGTAPRRLETLPRPLTGQERAVIGASNAFGLSLLKTVVDSTPNGNVFLSPLSANMALGMAANGAAGATRAEMLSALGFGTSPIEEANASYRSVIDLLRGLDDGVDFRLANSIWYRADFPFADTYLETGRKVFDATVEPVQFDAATIARMNQWASDATNGKITNVVQDLDPGTVMVLMNALYFKGQWRDRFDPAQTADGPFTTSTGETQTVKFMKASPAMRRAVGANYVAAELSYGADAFAMDVLVPVGAATTADVLAGLDAAEWTRLTGALDAETPERAPLELPRFRLEDEKKLNGPLQAMGMRKAFGLDGGADFSAMSPTRGRELAISFVKQNTFVDVNEEGTEAAAVTSVGVVATALPVATRVDRPFVFAIRERLSGTILFVGRIDRIPTS